MNNLSINTLAAIIDNFIFKQIKIKNTFESSVPNEKWFTDATYLLFGVFVDNNYSLASDMGSELIIIQKTNK